MRSPENPPLAPTLRLFSAAVILVLVVGGGLFFVPNLVKPRWPWTVAPFNARFLGGFYLAEMAAMVALLVWNRWSPGRLVLVMAFVFTLVVSATSLINIGYFDFGRKSPWLWFFVYLASVAVSGWFLWTARNHAPAPGRTIGPNWRRYLLIEAAALTLYGLGLLLAPVTFSAFWPWQLDEFHAQTYSAIFLTGAAGVYLVSSHAPREELLVLGVAQLLVGLLAILGAIVTDAAVHRVVWSSAATLSWLALFGFLAASGALKIHAARMSPLPETP